MFHTLVALSSQANKINIDFEPSRFVDMLGYMGKGMIVIFVIIGVIILTTLLINKIFSKKK
ncbi:MAG: hypothetical protein IJN80_04080 [Clostridia bacterium]|nr:hypothetical protein [Clostridia bacterium]